MVNVGWPTADVRVPRLLSAVHRSPTPSCATARCRTGIWRSRFRTGPPRVGGAANPGRRWPSSSPTPSSGAPSPSTPARPGHANPNWTWTPGTRSAAPTPGSGLLADDVEALLVRVPDTEDGESPGRKAIWFRSTPATSSSGACACCGGVSTAARRRGGSSTASSRRSRTAPRTRGDAAMTDQPLDVTFAVLGRGARTVHRHPGAHRPHRSRHRSATTRCTPSRCGARSASSRCDVPTPTTKRPG